MTVGRVCSRETIICRAEEPLTTVARLMIERHVGSVVIITEHGDAVHPVGIITDRDIVRAAVRGAAHFERMTARDAATPDPLTVQEDDDLAGALDAMLRRGVRRAPVVARSGALAGIVSVDDLVGYLGEQLGKLARLVDTQPGRERP